MLIKICGITRLEDAQAAMAHGADALGFVLWPKSPRFVTPLAAQAIIEQLPKSTAYVGVFVDQPLDEVNGTAESAGLTHVQLHGDETASYASDVVRPVIKATSLRPSENLDDWPSETMWLVDADDMDRRGGTGVKADWARAASFAKTHRMLLAGGLTPENVAEAIRRVQPFGIDVSSGVERALGVKDHARLAAFIRAAKAVGVEFSPDLKAEHCCELRRAAEGREGTGHGGGAPRQTD